VLGLALHAPEATGTAYLAAGSGARLHGGSSATLRPSRNHYVRGFRRRDLLGTSISELFSFYTREESSSLRPAERVLWRSGTSSISPA
jgi:hypothetical protein